MRYYLSREMQMFQLATEPSHLYSQLGPNLFYANVTDIQQPLMYGIWQTFLYA